MLYREAGQFKSTYGQDQQIFPILQDRVAMTALLLVAFVVVPIFGDQYWLSAIITPFLILALAALGGRAILATFGISIPAFRAAGGLVILLMGLEMLRGFPTRVQHDRPPDTDDAIVIPLAMPLIAGPGAITTVITLTTQAPGLRGQLNAFVAVAVTAGVLLVTLLSSNWIGERIAARGQRIFLRFMGLILVSIGAELLLTGVRTFLPPPG